MTRRRSRPKRLSGPVRLTLVFAALTTFVCLAGLFAYTYLHRR